MIDYVQPTPDFLLPHNQPITWDNMLRQDSGWIGTMWGKPWWADRPDKDAWSELAKGPPPVGTEWKYNDVRVNALALALTHLWKRPLPEVLKQYVADPIGMSDSWHWEGYDNSWIDVGWQAHPCGEPAAAIGAAACSSRPATRRGWVCWD